MSKHASFLPVSIESRADLGDEMFEKVAVSDFRAICRRDGVHPVEDPQVEWSPQPTMSTSYYDDNGVEQWTSPTWVIKVQAEVRPN